MHKFNQIDYLGHTYPLKITRKKIKRVILKPLDGILHISAPLGVTEMTLREVILKHIKKLKPLLDKTPPLSQSYLYFLGNMYQNHDPYLSLYFKSDTNDFLTPSFQKELKKVALTYFKSRVKYFEQVMKVKQPYTVKVRQMNTRLGSNSRQTHSLTFALSLIHYSVPIIDAIVVHELAHYFHFNHSKKFYQLINEYYPQYDYYHSKIKNGVYW